MEEEKERKGDACLLLILILEGGGKSRCICATDELKGEELLFSEMKKKGGEHLSVSPKDEQRWEVYIFLSPGKESRSLPLVTAKRKGGGGVTFSTSSSSC